MADKRLIRKRQSGGSSLQRFAWILTQHTNTKYKYHTNTLEILYKCYTNCGKLAQHTNSVQGSWIKKWKYNGVYTCTSLSYWTPYSDTPQLSALFLLLFPLPALKVHLWSRNMHFLGYCFHISSPFQFGSCSKNWVGSSTKVEKMSAAKVEPFSSWQTLTPFSLQNASPSSRVLFKLDKAKRDWIAAAFAPPELEPSQRALQQSKFRPT